MIRHGIFALLLVATGYGCLELGERGARALERLLVDRVGNGLTVLAIDWAEIRADGLHLELHGHAPDIFARDLALESARATAPIAVVIDHTTVSLAPPSHRDPIHVEIMRDERGLTVTGSFYGDEMRRGLIGALAATAPGLEVYDLTGINAARPGAAWGPEPEIAALAAARLPNAYVRFEPGVVQVSGLVRDAAHREAVSLELYALGGENVRLILELREPLVVAVPFALAVTKDASGALRMQTCSARDAVEEAVLSAALNRLGINRGEVRCAVALGGPSGDWAGAALTGLEALNRLPAGRFRLEYRAAELEAMAPTSAAELEAALTALAAALPPGYVLSGGFGVSAAASSGPVAEARYWLHLSRLPGGVVLGGIVGDQASRRVIETYAAALFGRDGLKPNLRVAEPGNGTSASGAPGGWAAAALVALDALNGVSDGVAELSPGRVTVTGTVANPAEAGEVHRLMEGEAPEGYVVESALKIDLPAQMALVPLSARRCAVVLGQAVAAQPINFAPGSAVFEPGGAAVLDALGRILRRCMEGRIEVAGHTDSQGSESLNQRLSQARAEAVVDALIARGIALDRLGARGYGETLPIATNETEQGRALNRRIAFSALEGDQPQVGVADDVKGE